MAFQAGGEHATYFNPLDSGRASKEAQHVLPGRSKFILCPPQVLAGSRCLARVCSMCFYLVQGVPSHEASLACCFLPPACVWVTCWLIPGSASRCSRCSRHCCVGSDSFPPDTWRNPGSDLPWALPLPRADYAGLARKSGRWCLCRQRGARSLEPSKVPGTCLVVQWLRLHTPMHGARVKPLVRELDHTCRN